LQGEIFSFGLLPPVGSPLFVLVPPAICRWSPAALPLKPRGREARISTPRDAPQTAIPGFWQGGKDSRRRPVAPELAS